MAEIKQDEAQVAALNEVNSLLGNVRLLNDILSSDTTGYTLKVSKRRELAIDGKYNRRMKAVLSAMRTDYTKRISEKASKHSIQLTDEEMRLLDNSGSTENPSVEDMNSDE